MSYLEDELLLKGKKVMGDGYWLMATGLRTVGLLYFKFIPFSELSLESGYHKVLDTIPIASGSLELTTYMAHGF